MKETLAIENDIDLHKRIMQLNYRREEQELIIKRNVQELVYSMHPSMMLKNLLNKLTSDPEPMRDLKSVGLSLGKDFLIAKLFGKSGSIKNFITSLLVKKATDYVVRTHSDEISRGLHKVGDFVKSRLHKEDSHLGEHEVNVSNQSKQ